MRVLLVGGSGQVGGHLRRLLAHAGHAVAATYSTTPRPGLARLALEDPAAVEAAARDVRPDVAVVAAGWTWVDGNEGDPARSHRLNVEGPGALARACARLGALYVTFSTDYVFDGCAGPYAETDDPRPLNVYGRAKLAHERDVRALGPAHLILRTTTVFGPEEQGKNFAYQVVRALRRGEGLRVPSDQVATPTYGPDVASAAVALIDRGARGTWNVAGPDLLDRATFARRVAAAWDLDPARIVAVPTRELSSKAPRPLWGGLRTDKLRAAGISLRGTDEALRDMRREVEAGRGVAP